MYEFSGKTTPEDVIQFNEFTQMGGFSMKKRVALFLAAIVVFMAIVHIPDFLAGDYMEFVAAITALVPVLLVILIFVSI